MTDTINQGYPLVNPEAPQRVGALQIIAAITAIDVDIGAILVALADKLDSANLAPAISAAIDALVGAAPGALDTLYEIATKVTETDDELDALLSVLASKADAAAVTAALALKADTAAMTSGLAGKADAAATTAALANKADTAVTYTKTEVDAAVGAKPSSTAVRRRVQSYSLIA